LYAARLLCSRFPWLCVHRLCVHRRCVHRLCVHRRCVHRLCPFRTLALAPHTTPHTASSDVSLLAPPPANSSQPHNPPHTAWSCRLHPGTSSLQPAASGGGVGGGSLDLMLSPPRPQLVRAEWAALVSPRPVSASTLHSHSDFFRIFTLLQWWCPFKVSSYDISVTVSVAPPAKRDANSLVLLMQV
jgi:hypothetical protein